MRLIQDEGFNLIVASQFGVVLSFSFHAAEDRVLNDSYNDNRIQSSSFCDVS
jgi:hypothetical protein